MKVCIWFGRCMGFAAAATLLLAGSAVNLCGGDLNGHGRDELSVSNSNTQVNQIGGVGAELGRRSPRSQRRKDG
jgi:hypothetical protein